SAGKVSACRSLGLRKKRAAVWSSDCQARCFVSAGAAATTELRRRSGPSVNGRATRPSVAKCAISASYPAMSAGSKRASSRRIVASSLHKSNWVPSGQLKRSEGERSEEHTSELQSRENL